MNTPSKEMRRLVDAVIRNELDVLGEFRRTITLSEDRKMSEYSVSEKYPGRVLSPVGADR